MKKFLHSFKLEFVLASSEYGSRGTLVDTYSLFSTCEDFKNTESYSDVYDLDYLIDCVTCTLNGMAVFLGGYVYAPVLPKDLVDSVFCDEILEVPFGHIIRVRFVFDGTEELFEVPDCIHDELPFS